MISVPRGTGDICFAYDIRFADDICLRHMMERILPHIVTKEQYIIRRMPYIISRSDISFFFASGAKPGACEAQFALLTGSRAAAAGGRGSPVETSAKGRSDARAGRRDFRCRRRASRKKQGVSRSAPSERDDHVSDRSVVGSRRQVAPKKKPRLSTRFFQ